jgi:2-polyprenyl-6-methoxyphenol hydroxylase-like FAD-dependent oxidoreductase
MRKRTMTMQNTSVDVLIVGAGPAGLTMACELLRRGVTCRILDKTAATATTSRAIGLQARSLEIFANMGIVEPVLTQGVAGIKVNAYSEDRCLFTLDFRFLANDAIPYPYGVLLPQNLTEGILIDLLHQRGGHVERLREAIDLGQENKRVIATVKHLDDGTCEEISAGWLIGCDGAHSRIRKALGLAFEGSTYQEEFLLADVDLDWQRSHDEVHVWIDQEGQFAAMPLPDNHWRLIVDIVAIPGHEVPRASLELFQRLLRERAGNVTTTISHPTWMSNFQINRRLVTSYRQQRVFLAGDAAHVHSPFGGQGANTGIQDAYNLAWKLALTIHGKASDTLLDTYQEERRPVAQKLLAETHQLTSVFFRRDPLTRFLRDGVVVPLLKREGVQRRLLWEASELGINYRSSSLSHAHQGAFMAGLPGKIKAPRAGDRAPDGHCLRLPEREETTLFQVFRDPVTHLLLFDGTVQTDANYAQLTQLARRVEELLKDEVKVHLVVSKDCIADHLSEVGSNVGELNRKETPLDWDGTLLLDAAHTVHAHYGVHVPSLCLIRPDGYIGLLCQPVREQLLFDYLQKIFVLNLQKESRI